jgi:hypothetical protein
LEFIYAIENEQTMLGVIQILHTVGFSEAVSRECATGYLWSQAIAIGDLPGRGFSGRLIDLFDFDPKNNRAGGYRNTGTW